MAPSNTSPFPSLQCISSSSPLRPCPCGPALAPALPVARVLRRRAAASCVTTST